MKILLTLLLSLTACSISLCQQGNLSYKEGGSLIKWSTIQYDYEGDLNQVLKILRRDLGREIIVKESTTGKQVIFNFKNPDWGKGKIEIFLWVFSNQNKHHIKITCKDKGEYDYLDPQSLSRSLIEQYFKDVFKK